jgi:sugar phosphate isomerase/epimerase
MKTLGFVSAILAELSLEEVLQTAKATGYNGVELMCWPVGKAERRYAGVTHLDVADFGEARKAETQELCAQYGVTITGLGYYPNPLDPNAEDAERYVAHLKRVITAAATLGVPVVNTFIGRDPKKSVDENWPRFLEAWPPIVRHAEEAGVKIGVENCPMYFSKDEWPSGKNLAVSPTIWRRMFEAIPSDHFGLNYDPSHLVWQHMDYVAPLREFAGKLFHVHAKDVRVDRHRLNDVGILATPLEYHLPKLPGLGEIEWGRFFSVLGDTGYRGPVVVEVEDRAYEDSLESRKTALAQSSRYLKQFLP